MRNRPRAKYLLGLAGVVAVGLALAWAAARRSASYRKDWLLTSRVAIQSFTNAGAVTTAATFWASNVGPRALDFQVWWFEGRAGRDRTLVATNHLQFVRIPLSPGKSTKLTMPVSLGSLSAEDCLCCGMLWWSERRARWRDLRDRVASWGLGLLDISWLPWQLEELSGGRAFMANIEVSDYFYLVHGLTRQQWLEDLARMQSTPAHGGSVTRTRYGRMPTAEDMVEFEARSAFVDFCQSTTNSSRAAESAPAPNPGPAH